MATLTLRIPKGSPLTNVELDANFSSLDNSKIEIGGDLAGTTSAPLVAKLQGSALSSSAPVTGQTLIWSGLAWTPRDAAAVFSVLDDVSNQFDSLRHVFALRYNGTDIAKNTNYKDSCDVTVVIDGKPLEPYVNKPNLGPWIVEYTAGRNNTFRMKDNKIIIYRAPRRKTTGFLQINNISTYAQTKPRYPFLPNTIVFGD